MIRLPLLVLVLLKISINPAYAHPCYRDSAGHYCYTDRGHDYSYVRRR